MGRSTSGCCGGKGTTQMTDKHDFTKPAGKGLRHARMRIEAAVRMGRGNASFPPELEDISATRVLLGRPRDWSGREGQARVLDVVFPRDLHIQLEATVARMSGQRLGMA